MARRVWYFLQQSARAASAVVIVCGVAMIVYSLWLLQKWNLSVSHLPSSSTLPKPWFIQACLGVGISVCLSTLFGHVVVNSTNASFLMCIYVLAISSLLLLEVASVITVFFRMDLVEQFSKLIDDGQKEFKSFVIFNIGLCRLIVIIALVPQICVIGLVSIFWGIGGAEQIQRNTHFGYLEAHDFRNSFLVGQNLVIMNNNNNNSSPRVSPLQSFVPYIIGVFRTRFPPRAREIGG